MITFSVNPKRRATAASDDAITTGSGGIPVTLELPEAFDGLAVTLVCKAGEVSRDVAVMGGELTVPHECLQVAGIPLMLGVYARDGAGTIVIPTIWASAGTIRQGTVPSETSPSDPTPSWAAQVQQAAADAVATANSVRADADAGAFDGADGYSPSATVMQLADGATISITDQSGTTTATVHDGTDGRDGRDGTDGADGFSPTATVTQTASGATISITDRSGTTTASVSNGTDGTDGTDGVDGFSPTVDVQPITGGHEVTITDADGAHSFDVLDGDPAAPGSITDAMLAPDGIKAQVAQLFGNQLVSELSGTIDTAADAYAAPCMSLAVDGVSTQAGTPTPDAPVPILSVDDLSLTVAGRNLLDTSEWDEGKYINPSGTVTNSSDAHYTPNYSPISEGTYTFTMQRLSNRGNVVRLHGYDENRQWVRQIYTVTLNAGTTDYSYAVAIDSDIKYLRVSSTVGASRYQLELGSTATAYEPYQGTTVQLYDGTLRSLPDGTKDTLNLAYLRPSTREGWAWYSRTLTAYTGEVDLGSLNWTSYGTAGSTAQKFQAALSDIPANWSQQVAYCTCYACTGAKGISADIADNTICNRANNRVILVRDTRFVDSGDAGAFNTAVSGQKAVYRLEIPITTQLDPIELPQLPAPNATVWCDGGSATPTYSMQYVQDTNLVIAELESIISDLATS